VALKILSAGGDEVAGDLRKAILEALEGAEVEVQAQGAGHFVVRVVCAAFEGKNPVQRQQMVYAAIAPFMSGETAPVHAIDRMETHTP
jgi:acid stress-induced BolA-like protein IbaG/YrbA